MIGAIVSLAILLVAVGGALYFRHHQQETARKEAVAAAERQRAEEQKKVLEEAEKARQEAKRRLDNQKAIENAQRKQQEEREAEIAAIEESLNDYVAGWEPIERGSLYFRYLEDSEYRCGSFPCFGVSVFSVDGCPDGVFMEVSLLSHDTVVDYTNGRIGHLDPWEEGIHIFDLVTNYHFDTYRIDNIRCYK